MALAGSWPPSCFEHPLEIHNELFNHSYGINNTDVTDDTNNNPNTTNSVKSNTLERAKELVCSYACTKCESCLLVNLPEVIKVILELVGKTLNNMNQDVVRLIILKLKFILKIIPENQKRLCSVNITEVIFDYFHTSLTSDSKIHRLLQKLVEILCTFHISVAELWKYFQLFSPDGFPTPILRTLNQICYNQVRAPSHYIQFSNLGSFVDITLSNRTWPPSNGYSISMWIQSQTSNNFKILFLSLENSNSTTVNLYYQDNQIFLSLTNPKESNIDISFDKNENTILLPNIWYHVTIIHVPFIIHDGHRETTKNVKLYINGIRVATTTANYPKSSASGRVCGALGDRTQQQSTSSLSSSLNSSSSSTHFSRIEPKIWNLGATYLFEELPNDIECFLLYQLGPDYIGNLDIDLKNFYNPYSVITNDFVRLMPSNRLLTDDLHWKSQLNNLQEKIIFAFAPRNIVFAQSIRGPLSVSVSNNSPSSSNFALVPIFATSDTAISISRSFVRDTLSNIGGISTIIFLIAMVGDPEQRRISLELLYKVLQFSVQNCREMDEICGYELVARLMRKNAWKIDEKMLGILFKYAGFERDPKKLTFSTGVLSNLTAFKYLIMDWRIWVRSELSVQRQLFETLGHIIHSDNEFSNFNIPRFRDADVTSRLLWVIHHEENNVNIIHAKSLMNIIRSLMNQRPTASDFNQILKYLILSHHQNPTTQKQNQQKQEETTLNDNDNPTTNDNTPTSSSSSSQKSLFLPEKTLREHILQLILDIILNDDFKVISNFRKEFKQEILLVFVDHPSTITRVLVLQLLNIYLQSKEHADKFVKTNGFLTLSEILSNHDVSDIIFSALFSILLGTSPHIISQQLNKSTEIHLKKTNSQTNIEKVLSRRNRSYSNSTLRHSIQATFDNSVTLRHPEALQCILIVTKSMKCPSINTYFAIKIIHDIFLQNDRVKAILIDHHLIRLLCEVFIGEFNRRNKKQEQNDDTLSSPSFSPSNNNNNNNLPNIQVEGHILSFLKAITVHSCTHGRVRIVESILHYMDMMFKLPSKYVRALQHRVISDVLVFFHENKFSSKLRFAPIFEKLCLLSVNIHRFSLIDTLPKVKNILDSNKETPNGYETFFRFHNVLPHEDQWNELYNTCFHTELEYYKILFDILSRPIKSHPFDILQTCTELYTSVSYFIINIITSNLPTKFYDPNDSFESFKQFIPPGQINQKPDGFLENKPIPAGNLYVDEFDTPTSMDAVLITSSSSNNLIHDSQSSIPPFHSISTPVLTQSTNNIVEHFLELSNQEEQQQLLHSSTNTNEQAADDDENNSNDDSNNQQNDTSSSALRLSNYDDNSYPLSDSDNDEIKTEILDLADSYDDFKPSQHLYYSTPRRVDSDENDDADGENNNNNENNEGTNNGSPSTSSTFNINKKPDPNSPFGIWLEREKVKSEIMEYILSVLCNQKLLDVYCNDVNFIISLLMHTLDLFHSGSGHVRAITFRLWAKITAKCRAIAIIKNIFNEQIYSYLQTRNPNELLEKGIHIDNLLNTELLTRECYQVNEKYVRENDEYKKLRFERMANLIIPTLKNNIISIDSFTLLFESFILTYYNDEQKLSTEKRQQKNDRDRIVQHHWKKLVKRMTHERAIWKIPIRTYKLDATEGPNRMKKRLKPSTDNPLLYYLTPFQFTQGKSWEKMLEENNNLSPISPHQMRERRKEQLEQIKQQELHDIELQNEHLYFDLSTNTNEPAAIKCKASLVSPFYKREGEFLVCKKHVYFIDTNFTNLLASTTKTGTGSNNSTSESSNNDKIMNSMTSNFELLLSHTTHRHKIKWAYHDIRELHKRRYQLKNNAMEIFLITGKTSLLSFPSNKDRDMIYDKILSYDLPNHIDYEKEVAGTLIRMSITEKWQKGILSNLEYLMHLNTLAGRSFNDLTQYPVFPFVLSEYEKEEIDLEDDQNYRDLSKPMGALSEERFKRYYQMKFDMQKEMGECPFMYGTHYSNLGSVLHFLIRLAPFSYYFIEFQGGSFDVPDRSFHSILQTWRLASVLSSADVKELIPSFYILPEFLTNLNNYNMGIMQKGTEISAVELPPWAQNDPRLFIKLHRKALESRYVSDHLHQWIDLIFGYKQTGDAAISAKNVFHPYTYEGVNIDEIEDELERNAAKTMIDNYGQTPKQVFKKPHPKRSHPSISSIYIFNSYERLVPTSVGSYNWEVGYILHRANETQIILPVKRIPLHPEASKYVSWGHWDQNLRVCSMDFGKLLGVIESTHNDNVTCASMPRNGRLFATGGTAGVIKLWKKLNDRSVQMKLYSVLHGHSDSITCLTVSQEWSIIVSGSTDKTCIIWDLNRCCFIYSLNQHVGKILAVTVSPTTVCIFLFVSFLLSFFNFFVFFIKRVILLLFLI